ncbi:MAG: class 1 fructose-bisphosphatase [Pontibacterium sp.]
MQTLSQSLSAKGTDENLVQVLNTVMIACKQISEKLHDGALAGILGATEDTNVQGETQKKLDVISNDILKDLLMANPLVAGVASEEETRPVPANDDGKYLVIFDPLDGSSNIDINVSVGTIFSILECPEKWTGADIEAYLQNGRKQLAAGYVLYGPSTTLTLTTGSGVDMFTLSSYGEFMLTQEQIQILPTTKEFGINMSNQRFWEAPMQGYIADLLQGAEGPREKNFNMRWVAAMVAEVHRVLCRGGVFIYPWDSRDVNKPGKLRLMYEGNPMALLVEQAGGIASTCYQNILDIEPKDIHQRVSVALGSSDEVEVILSHHKGHEDSQAAKLNT